MTENENVERIRQQEQPKKADEIKRAMNIGFHLKCLRCGKTYYHTEFAMSEMSYRMYSYCPDCIDKGIEALKKQDPVKPIVDVDTWVCGACKHRLEKQYLIGDNVLVNETYEYCPSCGKKVDWGG
jgi:NAD-dependent SIR2 family protein deacetylase